MDYLIAFAVGGIICAFVQILMEKTKLMPGRIMVILVVAGAILGAVGVYEPFAKWAISLEIVLLPEPDGPTRAVTLPWGILQETSLMTSS